MRLMVNICDKIPNYPAVRALADHPDIWCTVGAHPHEAKDHTDLAAQILIDFAADPRVVGIGECGLDFHYDLSPREIQAAVFRQHIVAARETGLPLVVHTRQADQVMGEILEAEHAKAPSPADALLHVGRGTGGAVRRVGAWFSVSGIATFKAAEDVRAVVREMPADRIIVETDCPYLAPVPHRGRRNEPAYLPDVLVKLAEIRGWSRDEAEQRTEDAFFKLFQRISRP
uniref:TatD family hydrolase n=1 Tax=Phenylobacterium glaciei TaxID=2803784 RepID=A0A974S7R1_9CAUL|nr:TatD family hydrolase [Phenylobacterium glaciei]